MNETHCCVKGTMDECLHFTQRVHSPFWNVNCTRIIRLLVALALKYKHGAPLLDLPSSINITLLSKSLSLIFCGDDRLIDRFGTL